MLDKLHMQKLQCLVVDTDARSVQKIAPIHDIETEGIKVATNNIVQLWD